MTTQQLDFFEHGVKQQAVAPSRAAGQAPAAAPPDCIKNPYPDVNCYFCHQHAMWLLKAGDIWEPLCDKHLKARTK